MSFAPGTVSGTASGAVLLGATDRWFLTARAGQTMDVTVTSVEGNSTFDVFAPDGTAVTAPAERTTWSGPLPAERRLPHRRLADARQRHLHDHRAHHRRHVVAAAGSTDASSSPRRAAGQSCSG